MKKMTALSLLRLLPPAARVAGGSIAFDGRDILALPQAELTGLRGKDIAMVFLEPMNALNPVMTRGAQIDEALGQRRGAKAAERRGHSASYRAMSASVAA